jgi:hypothetical protein
MVPCPEATRLRSGGSPARAPWQSHVTAARLVAAASAVSAAVRTPPKSKPLKRKPAAALRG